MDHKFVVQNRDAGKRLDLCLCGKLPFYSRRQIKTLIDDGRVLVNRKRVVIAGWELEPEDFVEVRIPQGFKKERDLASHGPKGEKSTHTGAKKSREAPQLDRSRSRRLKIYYEDRDIMVVEKPAGLIAVPSAGKSRETRSLVSEIQSYLRRRHPNSKYSFVGALHRLDTETSGVMIFALSKIGQRLEEQFKNHTIRREYTAIVSGAINEERGVIDMPLEKGDFYGGKKVKRAAKGEGKTAITEFKVKERYKDATLLEVTVRTGRTHQIRVHFAEKGHPLVGDKLYAGNAYVTGPSLSRHALHAHFLGFKHPVTGKKVSYHSPLPRDMDQLVDTLRG